MRIHRTSGIAAVLLLAVAAGAPSTGARAGPRGTARVELSFQVPPLQKLEVRGGFFSFPVPMPGDFASGFIETRDPIVLRVFSNAPWILHIRARGGEDGAPPLVGRVGQDLFDLSGEWFPVASGAAGAAGLELPLFYRVPLDWERSRPGVFETEIDYRLSPRDGGIARRTEP